MGEEEIKESGYHPADTNGDGKVSPDEQKMYLEFKRKELEDADAMRDAQRSMAWYSLGGMLLYPVIVVLATVFNMDQAVFLNSVFTTEYIDTILIYINYCVNTYF